MPVSPTYPGVYVEEIPSGVRTITGVATSITAFIGRAVRGPTDDPITINNQGDFERMFGGLNVDYPMSYAVRDFYVNGGGQAIIVRLYKATDGKPAKAKLDAKGLKLEAANAGAWGNKLRARVDDKVSAEVAARYGLAATDLFNLTLRDVGTGVTEKYLNVTVKESPRRIDRVLKNESSLMRFPDSETLPTSVPTAHAATPAAGKTIWDDDNCSTPVADGDKAVDSAALAAADYEGSQTNKTGLYMLDKADLFNLLCVPPDTRDGDTPSSFYQTAMQYCANRRAMLIVDPPATWGANKDTAAATARDGLSALNLSGTAARNAALYFPRVRESDPLRDGQIDTFVPCGIIAGVMARTDVNRGVWKAPAGLDAAINGIQALQVNLNDDENGMLNPLGINCLRAFPISGRVVWGSRTLRGADQLADEYKYVPVRRTALYIEESLYRGLKWVVFEPNDEPLWAQIRLNVGAFMHNLFRQGAFQGKTPREAYFVKCDGETTTQNDINLGIVNIVVGFAPLKPAEFVIIKLQQMAGQIEDLKGAVMAQFSVNAQRFDPYKNFKFRVKWDGKFVAGVSKVGRLKRTTEVVKHREGGDPSSSRKSPGRTEYEAITLERGVTHDKEFEQWANKVWNFGSGLGAEVSLKDFRKDIIIEVYNEAGQLAIAYKVFRCWVSEYQALPDLDANANAVAIQHIKLENEGWERDYEVNEPTEPTFTEPAA